MQTIESILESPDSYILIRLAGGADLSVDNADLRVMDQDVGPAVYAIWSESKQSIVALAFDKSNWEEPDAKAWVAKAKDAGKDATAKAADDIDAPPVDASLYAFWGALGDGSDAEDAGDGLIWKEILHPGTWFKSNTGKAIEVTSHIVQEAFRAFTDGYPKYISVPADHHWIQNRGIVPPETNRGFVKKLKLLGDKLFAGFSFTNKATEAGVLDGSIADVSAYLQPDVTHNATGTHYDWALRHVLLTNNPLVPDLGQWGVIAADDADDGAGRQVQDYVQQHEEVIMAGEGSENADHTEGVITLTGEAATEYADLRDHGYSSAQLMALAEQAGQLEALGLSVDGLVAQAKAVREKARELEISRVIAAMEGTTEHPGITRIEGFRHHPVVVEAVSNALGQGLSDLALSADEAGQTAMDQLVLDVANAIPEAGRLPVDADEAGGRHDQDPSGHKDDVELTDEQVDQFLATVGH